VILEFALEMPPCSERDEAWGRWGRVGSSLYPNRRRPPEEISLDILEPQCIVAQGNAMIIDKDLVAASATPLVLAILSEGESYGYAIIKRVGELSGGELEVDRGNALPAPAPPRAQWPGQGGVGPVGNGKTAQVLPSHRCRRGATRPSTPASGTWSIRPCGESGAWSPTRGRNPPDRLHGRETTMNEGFPLEERIGEWRQYFMKRQAIRSADVEELEDHLRTEVEALRQAGLHDDEAFLVAVKRLGDLDSVSREFAREYSERLWKQLVVARRRRLLAHAHRDTVAAVGLAIAAAVVLKIPELFGLRMHGPDAAEWSTCATSVSSSCPSSPGSSRSSAPAPKRMAPARHPVSSRRA